MKILLLLFFLTASAQAMDRWTALAMLESGGDDRTVGRAGEISRYQIRQNLWPGGDPLDSRVGLANARRIMAARVAEFERTHGRAPDDFEFYVLWNAPAQINHPHHVVAERARRFVNLVGLAGPNNNAPLVTNGGRTETPQLIPPDETLNSAQISDLWRFELPIIPSQPLSSSVSLR